VLNAVKIVIPAGDPHLAAGRQVETDPCVVVNPPRPTGVRGLVPRHPNGEVQHPAVGGHHLDLPPHRRITDEVDPAGGVFPGTVIHIVEIHRAELVLPDLVIAGIDAILVAIPVVDLRLAEVDLPAGGHHHPLSRLTVQNENLIGVDGLAPILVIEEAIKDHLKKNVPLLAKRSEKKNIFPDHDPEVEDINDELLSSIFYSIVVKSFL